MKHILFIIALVIFGLSSCDKVENAYPVGNPTELDYSLYPGGDSTAYAQNEWPTFTQNTNTNRNVLIEDFTGHRCKFCPLAADTAHVLHQQFEDRVLIATIHSGPNGAGSFQSTSTTWPIDWTNQDGLDIGTHLGSIPGSAFLGNPRGSVSRINFNGQVTQGQIDWRNVATAGMASQLKVNIQSAANYFSSTRGLFLHTEIDILDAGLTNELYTVVYLLEDSLVAKQLMPDNSTNESYVHRDVMRDCINSDWKGKKITENEKINDKYYFNYSFALPAQYNPDNAHLLIYVRDAVTEEIYQVIKQHIN